MRRQRICLIATEWGTAEGGVSVFNMRLAKALVPLADISCVVFRPLVAPPPTNVEVKVVLNDDKTPAQLAELVEGAVSRRPDWWIGHDVHTGAVANACRRNLELSCVLNHMDYLSYKPFERDPDALKKSDRQGRIFEAADLVAAVGPKLFHTLRDLAPNTRKIQLIPGCEQFSEARRPGRFRIMLSGRLSEKTDAVKQHRAALLAFADCARERSLGTDPVLTVVGADPAAFEEMRKLASDRADGACNVVSEGKLESEERYRQVLEAQSLVVVPSIYEGFSLVGWEALCAAVPVVLSKNTGLAEFIETSHFPQAAVEPVDIRGHLWGDANTGPVPNEKDVASLREAYVRVFREYDVRKAGAIEVRSSLNANFTWEESAKGLAASLASVQADKYYCVELGVTHTERCVSSAALSSRMSTVRALSHALKEVARSRLVSIEDRVYVERAELEHASEDALTRVLEAWSKEPWDFYLSYSLRGEVNGCVDWLAGMTIPVKGRRIFGITGSGVDDSALLSAVKVALKRARRATPIPTVQSERDEAIVARAVAGIAKRLAEVIRGGGSPPPWVLVMDPRLRAAVDVDEKKLFWRKEPLR